MSLTDTFTALTIALMLLALATLVIAAAVAYLTVCKAIEAHRRVRRGAGRTDDYEEPADHDPAAAQLQAWADALTELDAACCERWWTSLATDHDPTCPNQQRSTR
ncbi:hypothetical protein ACIP96_06455 [Streptomyces nigra]|uniref:hypothetical protein n=1 Tax=Streptomyces nigra TaxID=1827580 RepID=UPI003807C627